MINTQTERRTISFRPDITARGLSNELLAQLESGDGNEMQLEPVTLEELEHTYLYDGLVEDSLLLAAITSITSRLPKTMAAILRKLNQKLSGTGIKAGVKTEFYDDGGSSQELSGALISKPRSLGLFSVITAQIPCSDGQSVSIVFHAPDEDPKKITPDDKLIAFRFLLNKRDITHIVAPSNGKDISLDQTMMSLANALEKNSKKFQANIQKAMADRKELASKQDEFERLTDEIAQVNAQIDSIDSVNSTLREREAELRTTLEAKDKKANLLKAKITDFKPVEPTEPTEPTESELKEQQRQKLRDFIGRGRAPKDWTLDSSSIDDEFFIAAAVKTPIEDMVDRSDTTYMLAINEQFEINVTYSEGSLIDGGANPVDWAVAKSVMVNDFTNKVLPDVGVDDLLHSDSLEDLNEIRKEYGLPPLEGENQTEQPTQANPNDNETDKPTFDAQVATIRALVDNYLPSLIELVNEAKASDDRAKAPKEFQTALKMALSRVESDYPEEFKADKAIYGYLQYAPEALFADTMLVDLQNAGFAPLDNQTAIPLDTLIESAKAQMKSLGEQMRDRHFSYGGISDLTPEFKNEMMELVALFESQAPEEAPNHPFVKALKQAASKTNLVESYSELADTWLAGEPGIPAVTDAEKDVTRLLEDTQEMIYEWVKVLKKELRAKGISAKTPNHIREQVAAQASVLMNALSNAGIAENAKVDALFGAYHADPFLEGLKDSEWEVAQEPSEEKTAAQLAELQKIIDGDFTIEPAIDTVNQATDYFDEFELYETHPELVQANDTIADAMSVRLEKYEGENQ